MEQIPSLIMRKKKWFSKKEPELKISILRKTAVEGIISKKFLEKNLKENREYASSTISEVVDELANSNNGFLQKKKTIPEHLMKNSNWRRQKYYILTEKAIDFLIECEYLEINEFWSMLINIFDPEIYGTKIKQKNQKSNNKYINELISKYEKLKLKTSREFVFPENQDKIIQLFKSEGYKKYFAYWTKEVFDYMEDWDWYEYPEKTLTEKEILNEFEKIFYMLAINGKISKKLLFKKLNGKKFGHESILEQAKYDGLIFSLENGNKISLSPVGLLITIFDRHEKYRKTTSHTNVEADKNELIKLSKDIKKIVSKNLDILPLIFEKWKIMEAELGIFRSTGLFTNFFYDMENDKLMWGDTAGLRLLSTQKSMESIYRTQLRIEGYEGISQLYKWKKENNSDLPINEKDYFFLGEKDSFSIVGRFPNKQRIRINIDKKLNFKIASFADEQHNEIQLTIEKIMQKQIEKFLQEPENFQKEIFFETVSKIIKKSNIQEKDETIKGTMKAFDEMLKIFRIREPLIALINIEDYAHTAEEDILAKWEYNAYDEFLEDKAMNAIKNVISFYFYTMIFSNMPELWKILTLKNKDEFDLASWYEEWIHEIKRFNEDNLTRINTVKINY